MKPFFLYSTAAHAFLLAALVVLGTLLSKPRMSYYAVDLMSSAPAGGGNQPGPAVTAPPVQAPPAPKVVQAPKQHVTAPRAIVQEEPADQDTIRLLAKLKQKRLAAAQKSEPQETSAPGPVSRTASPTGRGGSGLPGTGAGLVAEAGQAFPFPWYLKAIADRLDKQWHPPQAFEPDALCQVTFVIDKEGQVSGSKISKSSGDAVFDQLALRAVLYANPLPPLPGGFPDDTLKVHMKFVGRRL